MATHAFATFQVGTQCTSWRDYSRLNSLPNPWDEISGPKQKKLKQEVKVHNPYKKASRPLGTIIVQHDGASSHIPENDQNFNLHAKQGLWKICLETQPVKSPDTNVLDLSFLERQWSLGSAMTIDGLVAQVLHAFQDFEPRKIDCGFLTIQGGLNDMLEVNGGNNYKIWHMGEQFLLCQFGYLPRTFAVTD